MKLCKKLERIILSRRCAGSSLDVRNKDIYLVSYPKSGNTWLRYIVANLVCANENYLSLEDMDRLVPDIYKSSHKQLRMMPDPRVLKSHESFRVEYKKVIYIVRDPRDVAVSSYYYCLKTKRINDSTKIEAFIERFINGEFFEAFGNWGENVISWCSTRGHSDKFLKIRYEDLLEEPVITVKKIAEFIGISRTDFQVKQAVERSSAKNMKKVEHASNWQSEKGLQNKHISFIREAKSGCSKDVLSQRALDLIEGTWKKVMQEQGYL